MTPAAPQPVVTRAECDFLEHVASVSGSISTEPFLRLLASYRRLAEHVKGKRAMTCSCDLPPCSTCAFLRAYEGQPTTTEQSARPGPEQDALAKVAHALAWNIYTKKVGDALTAARAQMARDAETIRRLASVVETRAIASVRMTKKQEPARDADEDALESAVRASALAAKDAEIDGMADDYQREAKRAAESEAREAALVAGLRKAAEEIGPQSGPEPRGLAIRRWAKGKLDALLREHEQRREQRQGGTT